MTTLATRVVMVRAGLVGSARLVLWYALSLAIATNVYVLYELWKYRPSEVGLAVFVVVAGVLLASVSLFPMFLSPFLLWVVIVQRWTVLERSRPALLLGTALVSALAVVATHLSLGEVELPLAGLSRPSPLATPWTSARTDDTAWLRHAFDGAQVGGQWLAWWTGMFLPRILVPVLAPGVFLRTRPGGPARR